MEKNIKIKTGDGHRIYGTLNTAGRSKRLIIFVHGLGDNMSKHHLFHNGAIFFPKNRFNTFRFDLYSIKRKGRRLSECSMKTHGDDLRTVIKHFENIYKEIYLVGHSLGGTIVLMTNPNSVERIVLWDPPLNFKKADRVIKFNEELDKYIFSWSAEFLIGKGMYNGWKKFDAKKKLKNVKKPLKIFFAEKGIEGKGRKYRKSLNKLCDFEVIEDADHSFNGADSEKKLFSKTLNWFKRKDYNANN